MDEPSILIAAFVGGALLQAIILIRADWNWLKIGVSIFISLGVVAVGSDKGAFSASTGGAVFNDNNYEPGVQYFSDERLRALKMCAVTRP
jgi:hypothetical protein